MDTEELMKLAAEKAVKELDWESIEYLLKPTSVGDLREILKDLRGCLYLN